MLTLQSVPEVQGRHFIPQPSLVTSTSHLVTHVTWPSAGLRTFRTKQESAKHYVLCFAGFCDCKIGQLQGKTSQITHGCKFNDI
jgi:hypothetical protein